VSVSSQGSSGGLGDTTPLGDEERDRLRDPTDFDVDALIVSWRASEIELRPQDVTQLNMRHTFGCT
jgi:hypothetical protein